MEINSLELQGTWTTFQAVSNKIGEIKLRLKPMSPEKEATIDELSISRDAKQLMELISEVLLDWNLTENGDKLPCNQESKAKFLPFLIRLKVKKDPVEIDGKKVEVLSHIAYEVIQFCTDMNSFVKN